LPAPVFTVRRRADNNQQLMRSESEAPQTASARTCWPGLSAFDPNERLMQYEESTHAADGISP